MLRGGERTGLLLHQSYKLIMLQVAGSREDHVRRCEVRCIKVEDRLLREGGDGLRGSEDGASEWIVLPEVLGKDLVDEVIGVVFIHLDLFEDDGLFALDVPRGEGGMQDEVGEDIEGRDDVLVEHLDVETDGLLAGEGVEVTPNCIDLTGDLLSA